MGVTAQAPPAIVAEAPAKGVNFHCPGTDDVRVRVFDKLAQAGTKWVRLDAYQQALPDPAYVASLARCADLAHARGIKVLWVLQGPQPVDPAVYAEQAAALVTATRAEAFEVWNEPNTRAFWTGTVGEWVALVRVTAAAVHAASPSTVVVTGGTSHVALAWLQRAYQAGLAGAGYDALGVHPYERGGGTVVRNIDLLKGLRRLQARFGDRRPVWLTELGLTTGNGVTQARYLASAVRRLAAFPFVKVALWYQATAFGTASAADGDYALLDGSLVARPAFAAYANWGTR